MPKTASTLRPAYRTNWLDFAIFLLVLIALAFLPSCCFDRAHGTKYRRPEPAKLRTHHLAIVSTPERIEFVDGSAGYVCRELNSYVDPKLDASKAAVLCWPLSDFEANEGEKLREIEEYKALPVFVEPAP